MSTCKSGKWPSRVSNGDTAAPAPQAQQGEQPVAYMAKNKNGGTESLIRARLLEQIGRSDDHDYTPLYAGVAPSPVAQQCHQNEGWKPTDAAIAALKRFEETSSDGEGYDIPKDTMQCLQEIGLVYRSHGSVFCITDFGQHVLAAAPAPGDTQ